MTTTRGCDLYHGDIVPSFHDVAASGIQFVILKSSEGIDVLDSTFPDRYARAKSAGLKVGAYHYFHADADPIVQAQHFLNSANLVKGDIRWALDVEAYSTGVGERALIAAKHIKHQTGLYPIIYTGDSFYQDNLKTEFPEDDYLLWIARYSATPPVTKCMIWQNSEHGSIPGVSGPVDTDVFYGSLDELMAKVGIPQ